MENVEHLNNQVDFKNLICHCKYATKDIDFSNFIDVKTLFDSIKHQKIKIADVVKNQKEFNSKLKHEVKNQNNKKIKQKILQVFVMLEKESTNFIMIFLIMTFLNTTYDAKHKATKERGLKILKILAHVKTGNNSNL